MVIRFQNVSKSFSRHAHQLLLRQRIAEALRSDRPERFYALKDVSFELKRGESMAVMGANGAGKSTLLSVVAGLSRPDGGVIEVNGRIAALLELGSGFHPDLTGRENVRLNASLLGLTRKRTAEVFESIVDFAGIGDFIEEPLRTYSSGMVVRLAFSVAINIDPEILLIDEVLAVGDAAFQQKCFDKVHELRNSGRSLLCVSHSPHMVHELCDRAIWLDHGQLMMTGSVFEVWDAYTGRQPATA